MKLLTLFFSFLQIGAFSFGGGYAAFYQLMVEPDKYIGKTLCIDGLYYTGQNEKTGTYYHYSIIKDALACCSQGLEFV